MSPMFVPQNDDDPVVDDGKDHDLQPDVVKVFCRINHPLVQADGKKGRQTRISYDDVGST